MCLCGCQQQIKARTAEPTFMPTPHIEKLTDEQMAIRRHQMLQDEVCREYEETPGVVWYGKQRYMTFEQLAAYAGPVVWFSPDEHLLKEATYKDIKIPSAMPFEEDPGEPVVYYRYRNIMYMPETDYQVYQLNEYAIGQSLIDLKDTSGIDLDYFYYYSEEEGFGHHPHDIESSRMKIVIRHSPESKQCPYAIVLEKVRATAHGVKWYDNVLVVDEYTKFPIHIFVEEGKHASCPDKNQDGHYTPSYDVNRRINDAWGVRDTIRSGTLFSGEYKGWMSKVRRDDQRVFPPLPVDSPLRETFVENGEYAPLYNKYILRPFPQAEQAGDDHLLYKKIDEKGHPEWPHEIEDAVDIDAFNRWIEEDDFTRSLSVALRVDDNDFGVTFVFPLLIVKHVEMPMTGGYFVNRVYLKDTKLRDVGWGIMYAPSASRWVDWYVAVGLEVDDTWTPGTKVDFVTEGGMKFRVKLPKLGWWGFRFGVKNKGYPNINNLGYVIEFGMGAF
jgi:hypothetical protein